MTAEPKPLAGGGLGRALSWRPGSDKFRLMAGILLALFGVYSIGFLTLTFLRIKAGALGDFFALWSSAGFLFEHPATQIYDAATLMAFQVALGMSPLAGYPFPYPPSFLLLLWPLGLLPYPAAYGVAVGTTLALYVWATVGARWRSPMTLVALLAPTTTITIAAGQAGFLAAALLIAGIRLASNRPALAGFLFGLASYKPQLGLLVPVALIAARQWRAIAAAGATVAGLVILTGIAFGPAIWSAWAANIVRYADQFAAENSQIIHLMPTIYAGLLQIGVAPAPAQLGQLVAAAGATGVVWRCFRSGPTRSAGTALFVGALLATPHAFVYDMPILATAVIWLVAERHRAGEAFGTGEILVLILAMMAPITLVTGTSSHFPLAALSLVLLLGVIVRRCGRRAADQMDGRLGSA